MFFYNLLKAVALISIAYLCYQFIRIIILLLSSSDAVPGFPIIDPY